MNLAKNKKRYVIIGKRKMISMENDRNNVQMYADPVHLFDVVQTICFHIFIDLPSVGQLVILYFSLHTRTATE